MREIIENKIKKDKIAGAIYGFAVGDAMGASTEFMSKREIEKKYPDGVNHIIGGGWLNLKPGEVTDDTQMTICVMNAFMNSEKNQDLFGYSFMKELRKEFICWYESRPKDIGNQCGSSILFIKNNKSLLPKVDEEGLGNGSLMRAMPLALLDKPFLNVAQSRMTHNNLTCSSIVLKYHEIIQDYIYSDSCEKFKDDLKLLEPSGYVINTLNNALYWSNANSFKQSIVGAVNDGGDADTIAAITGSLSGAKFGYSKIPVEWINELNNETKKTLENFKNFAFSCLHLQ